MTAAAALAVAIALHWPLLAIDWNHFTNEAHTTAGSISTLFSLPLLLSAALNDPIYWNRRRRQ